jgi:hypothetical protein
MKKFLISLLGLCCLGTGYAQTTSDVLENGIAIKSRNKIFLKFNGESIQYDIGKHAKDYIALTDSIIFLPSRSAINIYMRPLNPLNFTSENHLSFTPDPIDKAEDGALATVISLISSMPSPAAPPAGPGGVAGNKEAAVRFEKGRKGTAKRKQQNKEPACTTPFNEIKNQIDRVAQALDNHYKDSINIIFKELKALSFVNEAGTLDQIEKLQNRANGIRLYFNGIKISMEQLNQKIARYFCGDSIESFLVKQQFHFIMGELQKVLDPQLKRVNNLDLCFGMMNDAIKEIKNAEDEEDIRWKLHIQQVPCNRGTISVSTVSIQEAGYELSKDGEIVKTEKKEKFKRTIRIRRFQRFIPEASAGVAYTSLTFPKFGTATDSAGKQHVANAGEDVLKKINFTVMLNYNYFITNSAVHPFFQVGTGINANFPTLFTGAGLRLNTAAGRRLAISFGFASTWIKTLDKLKIGDVVTGTADIEKDIKYEFNWPPKPYVGMQYNF